jgi:hypothetical protein
MATQPLGSQRIGWVNDRARELRDGPELPARVATLDELLLVIRRDSGLRFDHALGFHLYGAEICLQARERGLAVVAIGTLCSQWFDRWNRPLPGRRARLGGCAGHRGFQCHKRRIPGGD